MVAQQSLTLLEVVQIHYPLPISSFERTIIMSTSMYDVPDHPDIRSALLTGYPRGGQPKTIFCDECGKDITDEDKYEDCQHECLCKECLLDLHFKGW